MFVSLCCYLCTSTRQSFRPQAYLLFRPRSLSIPVQPAYTWPLIACTSLFSTGPLGAAWGSATKTDAKAAARGQGPHREQGTGNWEYSDVAVAKGKGEGWEYHRRGTLPCPCVEYTQHPQGARWRAQIGIFLYPLPVSCYPRDPSYCSCITSYH